MRTDLALAFLQQNTLCDTLPLDQVEPYAAHHSGGLVVLESQAPDGKYVKMHDSWGDGENIVVHKYSGSDKDPSEFVLEFTDATVAYDTFLAIVAGPGSWGVQLEPQLTKVVTVVHTFRVSPGLSEDDIDYMVGNATVQFREPVVGHADDMSLNEITCDTSHVTVHWSAQDITEEV